MAYAEFSISDPFSYAAGVTIIFAGVGIAVLAYSRVFPTEITYYSLSSLTIN